MFKHARKFLILFLVLATLLGPMPGNSYVADAVTRQQMAIAAVAAAVGAAALTWFVVSGRAERAVTGTRDWLGRQFSNSPGSGSPPEATASTASPAAPAATSTTPSEDPAAAPADRAAPRGSRVTPRARPAATAAVPANLTCTQGLVSDYATGETGCRQQIRRLADDIDRGITRATPALSEARIRLRTGQDIVRGLPATETCKAQVQATVTCLGDLVRVLTPAVAAAPRPAAAPATR